MPLHPAFFIGNQNRRLLTNEDSSLTERGHDIIQNTPMHRLGEAEELNGIVLYQCSDASGFVTGTIVPVDGGFSSFSEVLKKAGYKKKMASVTLAIVKNFS